MYCQENPTGLPQSVRAPRAGWCPGSVSAPQMFDFKTETKVSSDHHFRYAVSEIADGGSYRVSAVAYAFGDSARASLGK